MNTSASVRHAHYYALLMSENLSYSLDDEKNMKDSKRGDTDKSGSMYIRAGVSMHTSVAALYYTSVLLAGGTL